MKVARLEVQDMKRRGKETGEASRRVRRRDGARLGERARTKVSIEDSGRGGDPHLVSYRDDAGLGEPKSATYP